MAFLTNFIAFLAGGVVAVIGMAFIIAVAEFAELKHHPDKTEIER